MYCFELTKYFRAKVLRYFEMRPEHNANVRTISRSRRNVSHIQYTLTFES